MIVSCLEEYGFFRGIALKGLESTKTESLGCKIAASLNHTCDLRHFNKYTQFVLKYFKRESYENLNKNTLEIEEANSCRLFNCIRKIESLETKIVVLLTEGEKDHPHVEEDVEENLVDKLEENVESDHHSSNYVVDVIKIRAAKPVNMLVKLPDETTEDTYYIEFPVVSSLDLMIKLPIEIVKTDQEKISEDSANSNNESTQIADTNISECNFEITFIDEYDNSVNFDGCQAQSTYSDNTIPDHIENSFLNKYFEDDLDDFQILKKSIDLEPNVYVLETTKTPDHNKWLKDPEVVEIEKCVWDRIFDSDKGKFFPRIWTSVFAQKLWKITGCVVYFKGNDILPKNAITPKSITLRGYCKQDNCRKYKIQWNPDSKTDSEFFFIFATTTPKQHNTDLGRWCNGLARIDLKN